MVRKSNIHFIYVLSAAMLWGTAGIFVRTVQNDIKEMQLVLCRAVFSALFFGAVIFFRDKSLFKIRLRHLWIFISAGLFSIVLFNYSYYTAMSLTSLSVAAVLLYTAPFFVVIMSLILFKERLTLNKIVACISAFIGCCLVTGIFDSSHKVGGKAVFYGLLTGFGYALYTIFSELLLKRGYKTLTITFYVFLFAALSSLPFVNTGAVINGLTSGPKVFVTVLLMAVFNTVLPYILYTAGLKGVSPSAAPIIATVEPVVATLVSVIYKEPISILGVAGVFLVLISVAVLNIKRMSVRANAKINLTLAVTGKRENGYHDIDTVMQSVTLSDRLIITKSGRIKVECRGLKLEENENIAYKAAKVFFEETGINGGAKIRIYKKIPAASGMGGGSADAAAVITALNILYDAGLTEEKRKEIAAKLGADVPFFIEGGTQRAQGTGELLSPLDNFEKGWFVLAKGESKPSTAQMYAVLDSKKYVLPETDGFIKAYTSGNYDKAAKFFYNSFTAAWENSKTYEKLRETADNVSLTGSGPTWFAYFTSKREAVKACRCLENENIECFIAKPCNFAIKCD